MEGLFAASDLIIFSSFHLLVSQIDHLTAFLYEPQLVLSLFSDESNFVRTQQMFGLCEVLLSHIRTLIQDVLPMVEFPEEG